MTRLKQMYLKDVVPQLMKRFGYQNPMRVPRLEKITLNMGLGEAVQNIKILDSAVEELSLIAGQRAVITRAKRSIAAFKLREGMPIGVRVTLRKNRMEDFFDKLVNVALPRVRDFKGLSSKSFDGRGNYTLGLRDQLVFPEVDYTRVDRVRGMNITLVTTAKTDEEALALLKQLGLPLRD